VNLLDLTGAFASVRAGHPRLEPWGIAAFGQEGGGLRSLGPPEVSAQELARKDDVTRLLRDVVERGTGRAAKLDEGETAGKTGTSQEYRDAWFIGFNPALVVGVWVGNDDRTPMEGVTGGSLPTVIWNRFVREATPLIDRYAEPPPAPQEGPVTGALATPSPTDGTGDQPLCDVNACAAEYSSFRASDCTYKPLDGGRRRLCDKGARQTGSQKQADAQPAPAASPSCDVSRCARQYRSFDAASCTYQPYDGGPRERCDK